MLTGREKPRTLPGHLESPENPIQELQRLQLVTVFSPCDLGRALTASIQELPGTAASPLLPRLQTPTEKSPRYPVLNKAKTF